MCNQISSEDGRDIFGLLPEATVVNLLVAQHKSQTRLSVCLSSKVYFHPIRFQSVLRTPLILSRKMLACLGPKMRAGLRRIVEAPQPPVFTPSSLRREEMKKKYVAIEAISLDPSEKISAIQSYRSFISRFAVVR